MRGVGDTRTPVYVTFNMNIINVVLNVLINLASEMADECLYSTCPFRAPSMDAISWVQVPNGVGHAT
ncbi:hypothetical protein YDYSG_40100 [Paenibacillus tyrfis]|nr:hypothetical protein YDYSG_40100 [Paenibacillus tyrfis]